MIIEEFKKIKSTRKELREFGLVVGGVLLVLGGVLLWKDRPAAPYMLGAGGALMFLGLIWPTILRPLQRAWMALAVVMGWVMTRVILGVLFYLVFTPMGILARISGKRFIEKGFDARRASYWDKRSGDVSDPKRYERQF